MTEIEKMYKLAKVKAINIAEYGSTYIPKSEKIDGELYPPFTAEKQLGITKLIGLRYGLKFITNEGMDYMLSTDLYNNDNFDKQGYGYGYDEAIANLVNNLWQDLTEQEKEKIRGILNENS